ncbi:Protein TIFY 5B [Raphanus sativus]|uniref:Protein TIFY 5B-like n=1 Tax=Raphanus sativus TaxID=3726 RepID=A0A9W3DFG2_RAPSA|nr:protein TIFY 5B-like [Raphanus sativus]KAJ4907090.1 Protein TIFY 5B [Raphanus sativus]
MEMQSNCDLELRLLPPPSYESNSSEIPQPKQEPQVCVSSDLIHLQATAILSLARRDREERSLSLESSDSSDPSVIPSNLYRVHHQNASTKRSLRSFLQKRNVRIQASSPYRRFPINLFM